MGTASARQVLGGVVRIFNQADNAAFGAAGQPGVDDHDNWNRALEDANVGLEPRAAAK